MTRRVRCLATVSILTLLSGALVYRGAHSDRPIHEQDIKLISRTFMLARQAMEKDEGPFGALLLHDGKIIHEAENDTRKSGDGTRHAEKRLVKEATDSFDSQTIQSCTLYTSTEPCNMCLEAIREAGISRVVYGTSALGMRRTMGRKTRSVVVRQFRRRLDPRLEFVGPVAEQEGVKIHQREQQRSSGRPLVE